MRLIESGYEIMRVNDVETGAQTATVETHHAWSHVLHASYDAGQLICEVRAPVIEGTAWQGAIREIDGIVLLSVDDSDPIPVQVVAGSVKEAIDFDAPGTYIVRLSPAFTCEVVELEVTVA